MIHLRKHIRMDEDRDLDRQLKTFVQRTIGKVKRRAYDRLYKTAKEAAGLWKEWIVDELRAPKTGRWYNLPGGGGYYASAPGEWPARKTGNLINSLFVGVGSYNPDGTTIRIYLTVPSGQVPYKDDLERIRPWFFSKANTFEIRQAIKELMG